MEDVMIQPTQREIAAAIRVLESLRQSIDAADSDEARKSAPESSQERHLRLTKSRIVERLASIEESVAELRRWAQELSQPQTQTRRYGNPV
jgi:predicted  nucleic acid-binding Zn-ribbon protein